MAGLKDFTVSTPRPLPVIILADVSGSMKASGKIAALNLALTEMVASFTEDADRRVQYQVAIITFGKGQAVFHQELTPAEQINLAAMEAGGKTPLGSAFDLARQLVEDKARIPSRALAPILVLVSDGRPTDDWQSSLHCLLDSERARKATRLAVAIGDDVDMHVLKSFLSDPTKEPFLAHEARQIKQFFRYVTMTANALGRPNDAKGIRVTAPDDLDY